MHAHAKLRKFRTSARKVRLIADLIRGKQVAYARGQLQVMNKAAAGAVDKLICSAVANWNQKLEGRAADPAHPMLLSRIVVNQATPLKRIRPRAQGRANRILKHACHVEVEVFQPLLEQKPKDLAPQKRGGVKVERQHQGAEMPSKPSRKTETKTLAKASIQADQHLSTKANQENIEGTQVETEQKMPGGTVKQKRSKGTAKQAKPASAPAIDKTKPENKTPKQADRSAPSAAAAKEALESK